ncbi:MAG: hypothetical protein AAFX85_04860 [Pseudomonadota bacterium]
MPHPHRAALAAAILTLTTTAAHAVGDGLGFMADESAVPQANANFVNADSLDFTYHACVNFVQAQQFVERGYAWISSYQDIDSVVPSQLNGIDASDYAMYAKYSYRAVQQGGVQPALSGVRRNYLAGANGASVELFLDPNQDTVLSLVNCGVQSAGNVDDIPLGASTDLVLGEKSETTSLANGDFELVFDNWAFSDAGRALFGNPANFNVIVLNGNITLLDGPLGNDHLPEGSGNLFWNAQVGGGGDGD